MFSVLYVDDERDLLEIGKLFLEQFPDLRVDTHLSAKEALASPQVGKYDAIVSDYQMPEMDGIEFLKTVRGKYGDVPFILFTGRGREEIVIQAINNGVDFYLQKGGDVRAQFAELAHKIRQAIARRKAEISLIESEKRLADIINFLPDATFAINRDGIIIAWNRAIEEMTGLPANAILGKGDHEYALPFYGERRPILIDLIFESDEVIGKEYSHIVRQKDILIADTRLPHLKGREVTLLGKASPLYNSQGEIVGAIEAIRDITVQKNAEDELRAAYEQITASEEELRDQLDVLEGSEKKIRESEARLRYMLGFYEKAKGPELELLGYAVEGAGAVTESPLGYLAFINDDESELSMYAWSKSAMKECSIRDKPIVYKTAKTGLWGEAVRQRRPVITNDYAAPNPAKKGYPQGHPEIVRHMNVPIMDGGHIVLVAGVANKPADYTDTDVQELLLLMQSLWLVIKRRRTEGALLESEEKYRDLFENSVLGIFRTTQEGKFSAINTTLARIAGYDSPQQMIEAIRDVLTQLYVNPEDRDLFVKALKTDGFVKDFEAQYYHRDGHAIWIQINARAVRDSQGEVRYYEGTIEDITGQKNAEDALKESEDRYRNIIELLPLGMHFYELLPDGPLIFTGANPAADTILGIDNSSFIGKSIEDAFPGLVGTEIPDQYRKVAADGGVWHTDQVIYDRGEVRGAFAVQAFQIRQDAMVAVFYDITKRKQAEEALKESEEKYRTILENIQDVYYRSDADGNLVMASPSMTGLLGYEHLDELIGKNIAGDIWLYPDRREAFIGDIKKQGSVKNYEVILKRKDGSPVTVVTSSHFHYDRKGGIAGVEGIFHDITAIRNADQQINLLAALIDISPVSVTVHDADGRFLYANQRTFDLHGYTREEFMGLNLHQLDVPVSEELINERIQVIKQKGECSFDVEHFRKDGSRFPLHVTAKITRWNDREVILSVAMDLSDRMEAERTLFESEERLQLALAGADLGTWNWNIETGEVAFNERWAGMLGYPLDEIEPNVKSWERLVHPDDMPKVQEILAAHLDGRTEFYECEHRMRHKDGSWIWVLDKGRVIQRDTGGRPQLAAGTHLDITARKLAEEELRQSEILYRTVIENIQDAFIRSDREGRIIMANPSAAAMLGFDKPEDLIGKPVSGFYQHPELRQVLLDKMIKHGKIVDQTIELQRKDGTVFWGSANFHCLYDAHGEMDGVEGSLHDITEYRAMERAVSEANHKLNLLNSMTRHDVTNQLTALQGFAQIAAMKKGDPVMADYLAKILAAADTIARQIEFTRTYQELGMKVPAWTTVEKVITHVESRVPVKFSGTCRGIEILADPMLERVFFNLFDNAVRHGVRVTEITVRCEREPDGILVIVEDNGTGVSGAEKEKIFERGVGQNTGLGLFLVREILSITNITIKETGVYGKGARFEISVPEGMYRFVKP